MPSENLDSQYIENKRIAENQDLQSRWQGLLSSAASPTGKEPGAVQSPEAIEKIRMQQSEAQKPGLLHNLLNETWAGLAAVPETAASLATGTVAWPISLVGGIGMTMAKGAEEGKAFEQFLQEHYTYQPKSEAAQGAGEIVGKVMETVMKPAKWVGEIAAKLGASPEGQFYITKAGEVATLMLLPKVKEGVKSAVTKKPAAPKPGETAIEPAPKPKEQAPGDAAAMAQKENIAGETAKAENAKVMEDLNRRAHDELQSALDAIPEEEWNKFVDRERPIDFEELATVIRKGTDRIEAAAKEQPNLPEVYRKIGDKEKEQIKARADNLENLAKEADKAGAELVVVPQVLTPREVPKPPVPEVSKAGELNPAEIKVLGIPEDQARILNQIRKENSEEYIRILKGNTAELVNQWEAQRIGKAKGMADQGLFGQSKESLFAKPKKKETQNLIQWVRNQGGLWDESLKGETQQFLGTESGVRGLVSKNGKSFDELTRYAVEDGWLPEGSTSRDFVDLLNQDVSAAKTGGARVFKVTGANLEENFRSLEMYFEREGLRPMSDIARDLNEIIGKRGELLGNQPLSPDKIAAYNRLKQDFSTIIRNAGRVGKTVENYLLDLGVDKEIVAYMAREAQAAQQKEQKPGAAPEPYQPGPDITPNLGKIILTDAVKSIIAEIEPQSIESQATRVEKQARGVRHHWQTESAAMTEKGRVSVEEILKATPGTIWNAEKLHSAKNLLSAVEVKVRELEDRVTLGDLTAGDDLAASLALFGEMQVKVRAVGTEIARAQEAQKIFAHPEEAIYDPKRLGELAQAVKDSAGDPQILARRIRALQNPEQIQTFAGQLVSGLKKATDIFNFAWINGLLSGPPTHVVNFASNAATFMGGITERGISGALGQTKRIWGGEPGVQMGEAGQMVYGAINGFMDALRASKEAWQENEPQFGAQKTEIVRNPLSQEYLGTTGSFGRALEFMGNIIGGPGRGMMTADEFWKGINYRAELQARAYREAKLEGLSGEEFGKRVQQIVNNPEDFENIHQAARDFANYQTFNAELGNIGKSIQRIASATPFTKLLMPFVRTPSDILKYTWERTPVLNMISSRFWSDMAKGGADAELALGKMALGTMAVGAVMALADSGLITGSGPYDKKLKRVWMEDGKQPYSVKVGDKWIAFDRMDPWGNILGIAADTTNMINDLDLETGYQMFSAAALALSNLFINKTYLKGIADFLTAVKDPDAGAETYIRNWARSLTPSIARTINRAFVDDVVRDVNSLSDAIKAGLPGFSKDLPPKRGFWGQEVIPEGSLGPDVLSPYRVTTQKNDAVNEEILRNRMTLSMPPKQLGGSRPSENPLVMERDAWGVKLEPHQYDRFIELARKETKIGGMTLHERLSDLVKSSAYQNQSDGPDRGKSLLIRSWINAYQERAEVELRKEFPDLDEKIKSRQRGRAEALQPGYSPEPKAGSGKLLRSIFQ